VRSFVTAVTLIAGILIPAIAASPVGAQPAPAAAAAAQPPATPSAGLGIRLVDAPTDVRDDPRAHVYIVDHLAPGAVIHRRIEVSNATAATAQVSLYAAAAAITVGSFVGASGHTPNELSAWTSVRPGQVALKAGAKQTVTITVNVPKDAAPGERYGVVWAEVHFAPQRTAGLTQISRVGIRLYLSIGPGGPPAANFTIDTLTAARTSDGRPMVRAAVHNTGGRAVDLSGTLQLTAGPGGLSAGPFPVNLGTTVGIGDTEAATTMLDKALPAGPWNAIITLRSGLLEVTEHATLTFPAAGQAAPVKAVTTPAASGTTPGWLYPAITALAIVLLAITVLLVVTLRRRRSPNTAPTTPFPMDALYTK